ncbi:DUF455 family protein [Leptospira ognonensis]|uniref:DUF455 family protein n=1 Tax=Leptospira ognonensis TaxID=2484945 RepID=A0A4R9K0K0_9LEPT|nr:DUF455 family protein [Leptospira ognonensis]TGL59173.1 DUF455 family protein [Leptospira ognonensis]
MKISEYAKHLLLSDSLEDKFLAPAKVWEEDDEKNPLRIEKPNRPAALMFSDQRTKIPRVEHLNQPSARGLTLHHFANHELMAIELFAFALLAFPDAPKRVKLGFLKTIEEEQFHLKLYLNRMNDFGIQFGDIPLNYMFWKQIPKMKSLESFSAIMSISFEGANLDFSQIYTQAFLHFGDFETAKIMNQVFEDEVKHVKRGLRILQNKTTSTSLEWSHYLSLLEYPLTPRRAKGFFYFPETRKLAGLNDEFCRELGNFRDEYSEKVNLRGLGNLKIEQKMIRKSDLQYPSLSL